MPTHACRSLMFTRIRMEKKHSLYLIPTPIGRRPDNRVLPEYTINRIHKLHCFVVEKPQTSVSFLKWINHPVPDYQLTLRVLNKKTPGHEVFSFLKLLQEQDVGLMSEAGAPGVADPGSVLVELAHQNGHPVVPLVGPSSILMALMASGLNGQKFAFHGYLPIQANDRIREIKQLEDISKRTGQTQIFMETPHRNEMLLRTLLNELSPSVRLCIASNITQDDELICTKRVEEWQTSPGISIDKKPALFLIHAL